MALNKWTFLRFVIGRKRTRRWEWRERRALICTARNKAEGIFDADWYLAVYPDVRDQRADPAHHFVHHGAAENRRPGPSFDPQFYTEVYPDVLASGENPLLHYIRKGRAEGRAPNSAAPGAPRQFSLRHEIVKDFAPDFPVEETAVLFVHAPDGRLGSGVLPWIKLLRASSIPVVLVVAAGIPVDFGDIECEAAAAIVVCDVPASNFVAWSQAIALFPELWRSRILYLVDDSLVPVANGTRFAALIARVRGSAADIVGLTARQARGRQLDGHFLALRQAALASWPFQLLVRDSVSGVKGEIDNRLWKSSFTARMQGAGLSIETLYAELDAKGPLAAAWSELTAQGCPLAFLPPPGGEGGRSHRPAALLAHPALPVGRTAHRPPRIAYFGPWNYESGLGEASREMFCALRQTGYPLNAYPIARPFHVHALVGPALAVTDFVGEADIAIVHLNPDNWHMLTPVQREVIRTARRRIGYWVWETDRVPPGWQAELGSVDRVWAPSSYCAEVFARDIGVPVDVVPHPVPLPALTDIPRLRDRENVSGRFGIAPGRRVILFVFDGASYLVRKNPLALIRAFAASGLGARGWTLLLKTKNLNDRPEAAAALESLVRATPEVQLLVVSLDADDLALLLEAADIYASPHCSEGFGLTVAEAMARGKPVVATDFGGTRDFLDATCGYPVKADPWTLEEDHGHYLAGHGWARIDETALTVALIRAADAVEAGEWVPGSILATAARARIVERLSHDAVAEAVRQGIAAALAAPGGDEVAPPSSPRSQPPPLLPRIDVSRASSFASARPARTIIPVCLGPDMRPLGPLPEADERAWYFIAPADAKLAPRALAIARAAIAARPDVSLFYADDVAPNAEPLDRVRLKPDFDPTLLAVQDYIGAPVIVRASLARAVGGLDPERGSAALYDFVWRMAGKGGVTRIPEVLIAHDGARRAVSTEQRQEVVGALSRYFDHAFDDAGQLVRRLDPDTMPSVTLVIPTRRAPLPRSGIGTHIERLLEAIARTDWPMDRLTVLVGDDIEDIPAWATRLWPFALHRIVTPRASGEPFNYAAKMNHLWRATDSEQIVLLNDDVLPHEPGWLKALQTFALDRNVGAVGALLLYEGGAIQHAGIFPSLRIAVHAWLGMPADAPTYQGWAMCQRRWSMVTGAVFATRRSLLERLGGFDERLTLEFNDIDLCLRMRSLGHAVVYNPAARFTHTEKASRGSSPPPAAEAALFLSRWSDWLARDPASHPGYATNRIEVVPAIDPKVWYAG
ncbi:MAG: glycosyltransferase [Sphingomonas bacterium]